MVQQSVNAKPCRQFYAVGQLMAIAIIAGLPAEKKQQLQQRIEDRQKRTAG